MLVSVMTHRWRGSAALLVQDIELHSQAVAMATSTAGVKESTVRPMDATAAPSVKPSSSCRSCWVNMRLTTSVYHPLEFGKLPSEM